MKERFTLVYSWGVILVPSNEKIVDCEKLKKYCPYEMKSRLQQQHPHQIALRARENYNRSRNRILTGIENMVFVAPVLHVGCSDWSALIRYNPNYRSSIVKASQGICFYNQGPTVGMMSLAEPINIVIQC